MALWCKAFASEDGKLVCVIQEPVVFEGRGVVVGGGDAGDCCLSVS